MTTRHHSSRASCPGRHRRPRTRYLPIAVTIARRLRIRRLTAPQVPIRPAREITLEARRRERAWRERGRDV
ncbi:MAG TPA: hypothetical protein VGX23_33430 [Actinocrinis sp.]|nr:hypothetical protein [Actinocrinis sp.]